jgi:hypothetical protein
MSIPLRWWYILETRDFVYILPSTWYSSIVFLLCCTKVSLPFRSSSYVLVVALPLSACLRSGLARIGSKVGLRIFFPSLRSCLSASLSGKALTDGFHLNSFEFVASKCLRAPME